MVEVAVAAVAAGLLCLALSFGLLVDKKAPRLGAWFAFMGAFLLTIGGIALWSWGIRILVRGG